MALSRSAPGTLDTVVNSMMDRSDTKAQKKKRMPKEAADAREDKADGKGQFKPGSPQDIREDRQDAKQRK